MVLSVVLVSLYCVLQFFAFRRGLSGIGVPDALSWVLAPVGLLTVIVLGGVAFDTAWRKDAPSWWMWTIAYVVYFGAGFGYARVAGKPNW